MEKASAIKLELKDLDTNKRTALIMHSVYNSIDRTNDIAHKGMFTKSWQESKPRIYINHDGNLVPGTTIRTFEDDRGAYTELKFGNWTLGNDALEMADNGVFTGASFGYETKKKDFSTINGRKIRNLREVKHAETSLLTVEAAHPEAGIVSLVKSFTELKALTDGEKTLLQSLLTNDIENIQSLVNAAAILPVESELYRWIMYQVSRRADWTSDVMGQLYWDAERVKGIKAMVLNVESFCYKSKCSDETIVSIQNSIQEYKLLIQSIDTAITQLIPEPIVSDDGVKSELNNFLTSFNLRQWQKKPLPSN